jgi:hypothetical protein
VQEKKAVADKSSPPNFSGTWMRDNAKSTFGTFKHKSYAKGIVTMIVEHNEPVCRVVKKIKHEDGKQQEADLLYYTDKRGEMNPTLFWSGELTSKTGWKGLKLVTEGSEKKKDENGESLFIMKEEWTLSSDGKMITDMIYLNRKGHSKGPILGEMEMDEKDIIKQVYRKVE